MRTIKAHKGGRTMRVFARLTPEEKAQLEAELRRSGLSLSDWIMQELNSPARAGEESMMNEEFGILFEATRYTLDSDEAHEFTQSRAYWRKQINEDVPEHERELRIADARRDLAPLLDRARAVIADAQARGRLPGSVPYIK